VLIMDAVLETYEITDLTSWPIADLPTDPVLPLSGRLSQLEVGTAVAVWAGYNDQGTEQDDARAANGTDLIRRTLAVENTLAPGGLRLHDTDSGVSVSPGCCFGLENWREWLDLMSGEEPWLGHDPSPRIEHVGQLVRLWPDGRDATEQPTGHPIVIPTAGLPGLLHTVQNKMTGFLTLVEDWANQYAPSLASALVTKLDEDLRISAPL
jgi:hypothetical protein